MHKVYIISIFSHNMPPEKKITVEETKIGEGQYSLLFREIGYSFIGEILPGLCENVYAQSKIEQILTDFTKHLSTDGYVRSQLDRINQGRKQINQDYNWIEAIINADQMSQQKSGAIMLTPKPEQSSREMIVDIEQKMRENPDYDPLTEYAAPGMQVHEKEIEELREKYLKIIQLRLAVDNIREDLNKNIRAFINNYIKMIIVKYQDDGNIPPVGVLEFMQTIFLVAQKKKKYASADNPHFNFEPTKYDTRRFKIVGEKHLKREDPLTQSTFWTPDGDGDYKPS